MHVLHSTEAYVLDAYPHGESSKVFKLFTRTLGLVYAHGQSVRELKNRNRYALAIGSMPTVTLVRGREVWRITSAQHGATMHKAVPQVRRILRVVGKLAPQEEKLEIVFSIIEHAAQAYSRFVQYQAMIEAVTLLRILDQLGYVARPLEERFLDGFLEDTLFSEALLESAQRHRSKLIQRVNTALQEAK